LPRARGTKTYRAPRQRHLRGGIGWQVPSIRRGRQISRPVRAPHALLHAAYPQVTRLLVRCAWIGAWHFPMLATSRPPAAASNSAATGPERNPNNASGDGARNSFRRKAITPTLRWQVTAPDDQQLYGGTQSALSTTLLLWRGSGVPSVRDSSYGGARPEGRARVTAPVLSAAAPRPAVDGVRGEAADFRSA
jgi:hypothetical protein